mmetsp:Transcript_98214/g.278302  ORF Transcript_98214/g.278302 Transcript_98214/m.278302 type:complete len:290 (+) Transcript_98214:284-1153(+)
MWLLSTSVHSRAPGPPAQIPCESAPCAASPRQSMGFFTQRRTQYFRRPGFPGSRGSRGFQNVNSAVSKSVPLRTTSQLARRGMLCSTRRQEFCQGPGPRASSNPGGATSSRVPARCFRTNVATRSNHSPALGRWSGCPAEKCRGWQAMSLHTWWPCEAHAGSPRESGNPISLRTAGLMTVLTPPPQESEQALLMVPSAAAQYGGQGSALQVSYRTLSGLVQWGHRVPLPSGALATRRRCASQPPLQLAVQGPSAQRTQSPNSQSTSHVKSLHVSVLKSSSSQLKSSAGS